MSISKEERERLRSRAKTLKEWGAMNHEEQARAMHQLQKSRSLAATVYRAIGELDFDLLDKAFEQARIESAPESEVAEYRMAVSALRCFKETIEEAG